MNSLHFAEATAVARSKLKVRSVAGIGKVAAATRRVSNALKLYDREIIIITIVRDMRLTAPICSTRFYQHCASSPLLNSHTNTRTIIQTKVATLVLKQQANPILQLSLSLGFYAYKMTAFHKENTVKFKHPPYPSSSQ